MDTKMAKVEESSYVGWDNYPVYRCPTWEDYRELVHWMAKNQVEHFPLSTGSSGYIFQVETNREWFALKWL